MDTLIGWWTCRSDTTGIPTAQYLIIAEDDGDTVTFRRHIQELRRTIHNTISVRQSERTFATLEDLIQAETSNGQRELADALEACWNELLESGASRTAPRPVADYWFEVSWRRFMFNEETYVPSNPLRAGLGSPESDTFRGPAVHAAADQLRERFIHAWNAAVTVRSLREGERQTRRLLAVWTVSGVTGDDARTWYRDLAVLFDGHAVYARDAEVLLPEGDD